MQGDGIALAKGLVDDLAKGKSVKSSVREIISSERSMFLRFFAYLCHVLEFSLFCFAALR